MSASMLILTNSNVLLFFPSRRMLLHSSRHCNMLHWITCALNSMKQPYTIYEFPLTLGVSLCCNIAWTKTSTDDHMLTSISHKHSSNTVGMCWLFHCCCSLQLLNKLHSVALVLPKLCWSHKTSHCVVLYEYCSRFDLHWKMSLYEATQGCVSILVFTYLTDGLTNGLTT